MTAALNVYRQVVTGQRTPANAAARQQPQQRQANQHLQVVPPQQQYQQMPQQQYMPQQQQYYPPQQQAPMTPLQQREAHRQEFSQSAMRAQQAQNWYGQWQQGPGVPQQQPGMPYAPQPPQGFQQQGHVYAPQPPQGYVNPNMPPALQQAYQQGYHQQLPGYAQPIQHFAHQIDERVFDPSGQFNPMGYGGQAWRDGLQQHLPDPRNRVFDASGQLNAYDNKDALRQIAHMMKNATREAKWARYHRQAAQVMTEERRQILAAAVQDPEGFAIMGQELLLPIKDQREVPSRA